MRFFIDIQYCEYSRWNFFGLYKKAKVDVLPMEIAIISERGDLFHAFFGSINKRYRIIDLLSKMRFKEVNGSAHLKESVLSDLEIASKLNDYFKRNYSPDKHVLYTADSVSEFKDSFKSLVFPSVSAWPEYTENILSEMTELAVSMDDEDYSPESEFLLCLFKEAESYTPLQKVDMFISHPDWPVDIPTGCLAQVYWCQKAYAVIEKYRNIKKAQKA